MLPEGQNEMRPVGGMPFAGPVERLVRGRFIHSRIADVWG